MKIKLKIVSVLIAASMLPCVPASAERVITELDFDGTMSGTWANIDKFETVRYPDETNTCLITPGAGANQITHTCGGAALAYYGKLVFSGDVYPMTRELNTQIFFKYYDLTAPKSGAAVNSETPPHCIDFNGGKLKVHANTVTLGEFSEGTKYSYKIVVDGVNRKYDVYLAGEWGGEYHPSAGEESEEYPGYMLADSYEYSSGYGAVGMAYIYSQKPSAYIDNIKLEVPDLKYRVSDFKPGSSEITFEIDRFIDTSTMHNLKLSRVGNEITELTEGEDYTVSWKLQMENYNYAAVPTITFSEPVNEDEQIVFDFAGVNDSYGESIAINEAYPTNPDSEAISAAYKILNDTWLTDEAVKSLTVDAPDEMTPTEGGSTVSLDYALSGAAYDAGLAKISDGKLIIAQPEADDASAAPSSFDSALDVTVTISCAGQPPKTISRNIRVIRRKLFDEAREAGGDILKALSDDNPETAWEPKGAKPLIISFDTEKAVGGLFVSGSYDGIRCEVSDDGETYRDADKYPLSCRHMRFTVTGDNARVTELEPLTSTFFEDVIYRSKDLMTLEYNENLNNLTSDKYLTLPKTTANGTPVSWSSSDRNAIDEYGVIKQSGTAKTVILTARAVDSKGGIIDISEKSYTATVKAKTVSGGGGGGGGGGGEGSRPSGSVSKGGFTAPAQATPAPEPTATASPTESPAPRFADTDDVPWAKDAIESLARKGVINGVTDTEFSPDAPVTREEFVKLIVCAFDIPNGGRARFDDVPDNAWYAGYVKAAADAGIIDGISDTKFGTGEYITRQDMAVMLIRTASYKGLKCGAAVEKPELSDAASTAEYAKAAVNELISAGILTGSGGMLYPAANTTRAEAAVMLFRFINIYQ